MTISSRCSIRAVTSTTVSPIPGTRWLLLVALENLRILREEKIVERVKAETAPYLQKRLRELADHPLVGEVRGVGMLGAIELVQDKASRQAFRRRYRRRHDLPRSLL